jgi:hypothetical protein
MPPKSSNAQLDELLASIKAPDVVTPAVIDASSLVGTPPSPAVLQSLINVVEEVEDISDEAVLQEVKEPKKTAAPKKAQKIVEEAAPVLGETKEHQLGKALLTVRTFLLTGDIV